MLSLTDAARELTAFGESSAPNQASHMRAAAHALREVEHRLQAIEATLAVIANRTGVKADEIAALPQYAALKEYLRGILR